MARPFTHLKPVLHSFPGRKGAGRPLLFLHGAWHGPWYWHPLAKRLAAAGRKCLLLELPGHGENPWPLPGLTSLNDYAGLAAKAAGKHSPVLVGHSMGGWLAQKILERADLPAALLAPLPPGGLPKPSFLRLLAAYPLAMSRALAGRPVAMSGPAMYQRLFKGSDDGFRAGDDFPLLSAEPARTALEMGLGFCRAAPPRGRAPRLLLAAEDDYFVPPRRQARLAKSLGAEYQMLAGTGHHLIRGDKGGQVAGIMEEWLTRHNL